jgi:leucyl aminopeptidase
MNIKIYKTDSIDIQSSVAILATKDSAFDASFLTENEFNFIQQRIRKNDNFITINQYNRLVFIIISDPQKSLFIQLEDARKAGNKVHTALCDLNLEKISTFHASNNEDLLMAFTEGLVLSSYKFVKYFAKPEEKISSVKEFGLICKPLDTSKIEAYANVWKSLFKVRDLVNEPVSSLNAEQLASELYNMATEAGCKVEIFNKSKIEALKMGGLLAVNKGSVDPPTFTIIEWKPQNAKNSKPYILVGKGVVYDTGGLSLKPTSDSMDYMKCDMSGAAIVGGTITAIAANKIPLHVIALVPSTDNRPSGNAYAPGDIVIIMDGTNVEMLNSDAEGRMILADALVYAKRYDPQLVIDVATLTGSAAAAIGSFALVAMGTASDEIKKQLALSGEKVFERIVEFPLWDDYAELIKSDIAEIKNVGGKSAGAITAGKFLEYFTKYPWVHFDIAGVAFNKKCDSYRGKGGNGYSMRLLYNFFENIAENSK